MLWGTLSYLTFAQEELRYVDYFGEYRSLTDKIIKKLNEQQTALLKTINQDTTIDECKELLSKDLVYIGEYQAGNYQPLASEYPQRKGLLMLRPQFVPPVVADAMSFITDIKWILTSTQRVFCGDNSMAASILWSPSCPS